MDMMLLSYLTVLTVSFFLIVVISLKEFSESEKKISFFGTQNSAHANLLHKNFYLRYYPYIFWGYLFCLLSFGRMFLIINVPFRPVPIFITEIFLVISLPYFIFNFRDILNISTKFLTPFLIFCGLGWVYLIEEIVRRNLFAFRDIVLSVYPFFFFFLAFFAFRSIKNKMRIVFFVLIADVFLLVLGRLFCGSQRLLESGSMFPMSLIDFSNQMVGFNFTFYYGVVICVLLSLVIHCEEKLLRISCAFLTALNIHMLIIMPCRSSWIAGIVVLIFFLAYNFKRIQKLFFFLILTLFFVFLLNLADWDFNRGRGRFIAKGKMASFKGIVSSLTSKIQVSESKIPAPQPSEGESHDLHGAQETIARPAASATKKTGVEEKAKTELSPTYEQEAYNLPLKTEIEAIVKEDKPCQIDQQQDQVDQIADNRHLKKQQIQTIDSIMNANWRVLIWQQSIRFTRDSVFFGRGFGVYPDFRLPNGTQMRQTHYTGSIGINSGIIPCHNHLITFFYKMGFMGLGLFLFFNAYAFWAALNVLRVLKGGAVKLVGLATVGAFIWWHVMALTSNMIDSPAVNIFLWIFLGIFMSIITFEKGQEPEDETKNYF